MAYETKNGQGSMFERAAAEKKSPKEPDFSGSFITPKGEHLQIAGWKRKSQSGKKYLSLSVQEPKPMKEEKPSNDGW